jgi:tetratricopeptide (TPR) repeat protein
VRDDAETEVYLGYSYYNLQKVDSALMALNKSIELDPNYIPAYLYAGSFCLEQGNNDLALKYLTIASRLDPTNTTVLFYKGIALVEKENLDEGCSCLNKAFYAGEDDASDYLSEYCYGSK